MKNNYRIIGVFIVLLISLLSIQQPKVNWASFKTEFNMRPPDDLSCVAEAIPSDSVVLFFTNLNGRADFSQYAVPYAYATYYLIPRILIGKDIPITDINSYEWLIAYNMDETTLNQFMRNNKVSIYKTCDRNIVLRRTLGT